MIFLKRSGINVGCAGRWFVIAASVVSVLLSLGGAARNFPSIDEVAHFPAGLSHWRYSRFDLYRVNPPLVRTLYCFPSFVAGDSVVGSYSIGFGKRPEFLVGIGRLRQEGLRFQKRFLLPRVVGIVVFLLFIWKFYFLLSASIGQRTAEFGVFFLCFSPSILANIPTIVPDLGSTIFGFFACIAAWRYCNAPSSRNSLIAGVGLGLALLSKLTWILAAFTLPLTVLCCATLLNQRSNRRSLKNRFNDLLIYWSVALIALNAGYLFEGSFTPLGHYQFCSEMLGGEGCNTDLLGNRFRESWLGVFPVPLPRNYLLGIDYLKHEVEGKMWSFLMGEWRFGSWPHYYIMTVLFKTPEPTLLAALIGLSVLIVGIRKRMVSSKVITLFFFLGVPSGVCFVSISYQGGFNHHHRYVLMIYPLIFTLAAYIVSPVGVKLLSLRFPSISPQKRSVAIPLAIVLVLLSVVSSLRVHPHYTSYFNTFSGGPENGWRLLGSSNIDWGQDILEVDNWLRTHPDLKPLVMDLGYFNMNGELFNVQTSRPPELPKGASIDEVRRTISHTQWWIINVKSLYNRPGEDGLEYLQQIEPITRIAYAYHVYRLDPLFEGGGSPFVAPRSE